MIKVIDFYISGGRDAAENAEKYIADKNILANDIISIGAYKGGILLVYDDNKSPHFTEDGGIGLVEELELW